jgi:hypothetical protein
LTKTKKLKKLNKKSEEPKVAKKTKKRSSVYIYNQEKPYPKFKLSKEFQREFIKFMRIFTPLIEGLNKDGNFVAISPDMLSNKIRGFGPDEGDASGDETN